MNEYVEYMKTLKDEILNNFSVYGADHGLMKNAEIITNWRDEGEIDEQQFKELRRFNRVIYSQLPLDM